MSENEKPAEGRVSPPPATLYRLIERDGTVWQLGMAWPVPTLTPGQLASMAKQKGSPPVEDVFGQIDCLVNAIIYITTEDDENGETVDIDPYYQIIGMPMSTGKMAERALGVTTDIQEEDVKRTEGLQDAQVLGIYILEMLRADSAGADSGDAGTS